MVPPSHHMLSVFILTAENYITEATGQRENWRFWWEHRKSGAFDAQTVTDNLIANIFL